MKATLGMEEVIIKRVSVSEKETSAKVYLPKRWDGRMVVIIPLSFEGETEVEVEVVEV
jgi:hypothetical protein